MAAVGGASTSVAGIAGLSQLGDSHEELSSSIPPPVEIKEEFQSTTLAFEVVANIVAVPI